MAVGTAAAMTPAVLDVDVSSDATGQTALNLVSTLDIVIGLSFVLVCFGLLIALFTDSGF